MKKVVAAIISTTMLATMGMGVMAATPTINTNNTATLHVHKYETTTATVPDFTGEPITLPDGLTPIEGVTFSYLKVGDIVQNNTNGDDPTATAKVLLEYHLTEQAKTLFGTTKNVLTLTEVQTALNGKSKHDLEEFAKNNGTEMTATDENGDSTAANLPLGLYLVAETGVPAIVSSTTFPFLVTLPMTNAAGNDWNYNVHVYPKNETDEPTLEKYVKDNSDAKFKKSTSSTIGNEVEYLIVSEIPSLDGAVTHFTKYEFEDTLPKGMTYVNGSAKAVIVNKTALPDTTNLATAPTGTELTTTVSATSIATGDTLAIKPNTAGLAAINANGGNYIVLTYKVKVGDSIQLGDLANINTIKLKYTKDGEPEEKEDKASVHSYGLNLKKTFSDGNTANFNKVEFILKNKTDNYYVVATGTAGNYKVNTTNTAPTKKNQATHLTPAADGTLKIDGLEADEYLLTEVKTAPGYSLLNGPITIKISETTEAGGVLVGASAKVDDKDALMSPYKLNDDTESENARVEIDIVNNKSFILPKTGGVGTLIFTVLGALVIAGGILLVIGGKKEKE